MDTVRVAEEIIGRRNGSSVFMVGIDGLGGAGKSTVSEDIKRLLQDNGINTEIFHIDDFIHPRAVRYNDSYPQWEQYYYLQWRYDHFTEAVAGPARDGRALSPVELYDKDNDSYIVKRLDIPVGSVILTEGIFLQREELNGLFDYMIYIDVPEEERLCRVLLRDGYIGDEAAIREKYEKRYFPAERFYADKYRPAEKADLVIKR
ncbi:uridine kinase [Ruminococcus flavefaciens]|uniref:Phosphoribulokinase/uridine kinase domain-containing protein n=1 Tax=Ruminococcus flavefaciens 007c TaxID=1341157 RepID=W7UZ88_RUMFL|nr:uridine kinase [Ruminococcus flavefaciens]EWM54040.1 hypothetical protein RF007C_03760 [Ruminococcus flavefaciens 007c]